MPDFIDSSGEKIAFQNYSGVGRGVFYIGGHRTVMTGGPKCEPLRDYCRSHNIPFTCFDYAGWGLSSGPCRDYQIDQWAENTVAVFDHAVKDPAIVIGNSMGGYIMLLLALARPEKVAGLLGLAPGLGAYIQTTGRQDIAFHPGNIKLKIRMETQPVTYHALDQSLPFEGPLRCIHSLADDIVPWYSSVDIVRNVKTDNAHIELIKDGEHSLCRAADIEMIIRTLERLRKECAV